MSYTTHKGFALLYALLVTTITLSAGLIVTSIITRQLKTTNIGSRAFLAYAAADDGYRCALLWDKWKVWYDGSSQGGILSSDFSSVAGATCSGQAVTLAYISGTTPSACDGKNNQKQFTLSLSSTNRTAVGITTDPQVIVYICANDTDTQRTFISQGSDTGDVNNPRRVTKLIQYIPGP